MSIKYLVSIFVLASMAILFTAIVLSKANLPNREKNGFNRSYNSAVKEPTSKKIINEFAVRISGVTDSNIYFSGRDPQWVISTDFKLSVIDTFYFHLEESELLRDPNIIVDYPDVYMYAFQTPYLIRGTVFSNKVDTFRLNTNLITRVAQISSDRLVVRAIDSTQSRQVFKVVNALNGMVSAEKEVFAEQQFGGFERDGIIKYDKETNLIYYTAMFSNEIFCLDTLLNIVYKGRTIDTTSMNKVNIGIVNESGESRIMSTKPRQVINRLMDVNNGSIYVLSSLRADNESLIEFNKTYVIDIYNTSTGSYTKSIRLSKMDQGRILDFKVHKGSLIAMFEKGECEVYSIN